MELLSDLNICLKRRKELKSVYTESINNFNKFLKDKLNIPFSDYYSYDYDRCEIYTTIYYQKPLDMLDIYKSLKDYNLVGRFQVDVISISESSGTIDYTFRYRLLNIEHKY